ncbi:uncharacterized protein PAN0_008d3480 [Moesziomyces antarcticus]|uniref:Uncharacterized protein n=2 Tax=Pseudozyma antarctica TaxID=84753 RepID=A0A5C3FRT4_PSEA2|nr:uncharacterized protein PAN0_008d3480 [Moesziomyces antarcticus]GAK65263.1 hypothetical protein PAN0_008d3480 [Moesziomyces antarcticus]SPO46267.1 uncharacterized protein PSANT_03953 [Moesziomyces antarcticus]
MWAQKRFKSPPFSPPVWTKPASRDDTDVDTIDGHPANVHMADPTPTFGRRKRSDSSAAAVDLLGNPTPTYETRKQSASPVVPASGQRPSTEVPPASDTLAEASVQRDPPPPSRYAYLLRRRERAGAWNVQAEMWQVSREGPEQIPLSSRLQFTPLDEIDDYGNNESVNVLATVASVEGLIQPMNCPFWPVAITDSPGHTRTLRVFLRREANVELQASLQALEADDVSIVLQASVYNGSLSAFDKTSILIAKDRESACAVAAAE